jgi:hypothetical protein
VCEMLYHHTHGLNRSSCSTAICGSATRVYAHAHEGIPAPSLEGISQTGCINPTACGATDGSTLRDLSLVTVS